MSEDHFPDRVPLEEFKEYVRALKEIKELRAELAALRDRAERLERACEKARLVIGKGRCTCSESETAARILSRALAGAPPDPDAQHAAEIRRVIGGERQEGGKT